MPDTPTNLPSGWGTYINHEDHYSISYPGAAEISIGHGEDTSGLTKFTWGKFSKDSLEIENVAVSRMILPNPPTPCSNGSDRERQLSRSPVVTQEDVAVNGLTGFIASNSQTQTVVVFLSLASDYSIAYELTFQAGSSDYVYPGLRKEM